MLVYTGMVPFINLPSRHHQVWQTGGARAMYSPSRSWVWPITSYMDPWINYTLKKNVSLWLFIFEKIPLASVVFCFLLHFRGVKITLNTGHFHFCFPHLWWFFLKDEEHVRDLATSCQDSEITLAHSWTSTSTTPFLMLIWQQISTLTPCWGEIS